MTRKDYEAIASALKIISMDIEHGHIETPQKTMREIETRLCTVFAKDNERFDVQRFLNACVPYND